MNAYKNWQTPLSLADVFAKPAAPSYLTARDGFVYWMESLATEGGRTVIKRVAMDRLGDPIAVQCLTPAGFNVRTKANEYGGKAYVVGADAIYFCHYTDQRIYRQALPPPAVASGYDLVSSQTSQPVALTDTKGVYFADLSLSHDEQFLLFVMETSTAVLAEEANLSVDSAIEIDENRSEIAYIALLGDLSAAMSPADRVVNAQDLLQRPVVLQTGADFYAALSLSTTLPQQITWVEWQHPNMPWDATTCQVAELISSCDSVSGSRSENVSSLPTLSVQKQQVLVDGSLDHATASHPQWLPDGRLLLSIDWPQQDPDAAANFANLYSWQSGDLTPLTQGKFEYSYPHWIFGNHRVAYRMNNTVLAIATGQAGDELHLIDLASGEVQRIAEEYCVFNYCCASEDRAFIMAASVTAGSQMLQVDQHGHVSSVRDSGLVESEKKEEMALAANDISVSTSLCIPAIAAADLSTLCVAESSEYLLAHSLGQPLIELEHCYAHYYPPQNNAYVKPDTAPPLLVIVHGGPTAQANRAFDIQKQFWTTSGFAILDVNHRGSSGYGRCYRDALLNHWGVVDADDIRAAIQYAVDNDLADAHNVYIRGKSAGGYAVQRALTLFPELFAAGASYYGIGDLAALAAITHKFEAYYCDQLLGERFDVEQAKNSGSRYFQRSPINFMAQITCPMILFQGLEDKVVPPVLSQQVADLLQQNNLPYEYHYYANEGHGFRAITTLVDCLQKELAFFRAQMR